MDRRDGLTMRAQGASGGPIEEQRAGAKSGGWGARRRTRCTDIDDWEELEG